MNIKRVIVISVSALVGAVVLAVAIPFTVLAVKTANIKNDYAYLIEDAKYKTAVEVEGLEHVTQEISCGYATIEMMSAFYGERVSEETLSERNNGAITTSSSSGFLDEINKTIKDKEFKKSSYLKNEIRRTACCSRRICCPDNGTPICPIMDKGMGPQLRKVPLLIGK